MSRLALMSSFQTVSSLKGQPSSLNFSVCRASLQIYPQFWKGVGGKKKIAKVINFLSLSAQSNPLILKTDRLFFLIQPRCKAFTKE